MHEKREALDAIELLKLFAKHKGISIEIAADADTPNQFHTTTITTDENSGDASATNYERDSNSITMASANKNTTKSTTRVIHKQPASPAISVQQSSVPTSDELRIEHATPIDIMKNTADI